MRIAAVALSCSLLLATACATDYAEALRRMKSASNESKKVQILQELLDDPNVDPELRDQIEAVVQETSYGPTIPQVERMIRLRAFAESSVTPTARPSAAEQAQRIKRSPLYRDPGEREESNWFAKGFERLGTWLQGLLRRLFDREAPAIDPAGAGAVLPWLRVLLWALLIAGLGAFLFFAARHFSWRSQLKRRSTPLLDETEPERSRDEYLEEADRLAAAGKAREAVRCLFLACLLLFDESGIARFLRGQTNWEHLRRIEASPKLPGGLDFQPATLAFDRVWYGMDVRGIQDVDAMRSQYLRISGLLRGTTA